MKGQKFHKLTGLYATTMLDRLSLVKDNWSHYNLLIQIQQGKIKNKHVIEKPNSIHSLYQKYPSPISDNLKKLLEYNHPIHLDSLTIHGIKLDYYKTGQFLHTKSQAEPDIVVDMRESIFEDKRIHGVDVKAYVKLPNEIDSRAFSQVSKEDYKNGLRHFENLIINNIPELASDHVEKIKEHLISLKESCDRKDLTLHYFSWAKGLHLYPEGFIPPIRIPDNFDISKLKPQVATDMQKAYLKMKAISNYLFEKKVPNTTDKNDIIKALDHFEDSFIQDLLGSH